LEEAYEVAEAIAQHDMSALRANSRLAVPGLLPSRMAEEAGQFAF